MKTDQYTHPDYYGLDELYSDEHKLVRDAARAWVKKEVSPIIDDCYEKAVFPKHLIPGLGEIGAFGRYILSLIHICRCRRRLRCRSRWSPYH